MEIDAKIIVDPQIQTLRIQASRHIPLNKIYIQVTMNHNIGK